MDFEKGVVLRAFNLSSFATLAEQNAQKLCQRRLNEGDVLNGIAYNQITDEFLITGKMFPFYISAQFN